MPETPVQRARVGDAYETGATSQRLALPTMEEGATLQPAHVPADWGDVTPEWMTAAIASRHPRAQVDDVTLISWDDGTNRRARFRLTYATGSGPEVVFVKAEGAHRVLHSRNGNLFNECDLFASGVPLAVDHPLVYKVIIDRPALDYVIVMEDVTRRGGDPRDSTRPMTVDQVANALRGLGRLHSQYWGFSGQSHPELAWVQTWEPTEGFQSGLRAAVPTGLERGGVHLPPEVTNYTGDQIVDIWARFVNSLVQDPMTLLHADAHIGNTYVLPDDDVGFLDWQVVRRGNWSQDVGYFLMGALSTEDRRAGEAELIEEFRRALDVPKDERPTTEQAWLRYRASAAYGMAIWLSTLGTDGFQSREVSLTLAERYSAAFVELGTMDALALLKV